MSRPDSIIAEALSLLGAYSDNGIPVCPGIDHDVVGIGGGHTGSAFAFALNRAGITRFSLIDAAAVALESRAGTVHLFARRDHIASLAETGNASSPAVAIPQASNRIQFWQRRTEHIMSSMREHHHSSPERRKK